MIKIQEDLEKMYAGLPEWGGFGKKTEYENAFGQFTEACHCVLGSLHISAMRYNEFKQQGNEQAINQGKHIIQDFEHIDEEISITEKVVRVYDKEIYINDFNTKADERYLDDLINNANNLKNIAKNSKDRVTIQFEYPDYMVNLSIAALNSIITLCSNIEHTMNEGLPVDIYSNVFGFPSVKDSVDKMRMKFEIIKNKYK